LSSLAQTMVGSALLPEISASEQAETQHGVPAQGLVSRLRGVPKSALKTVLGKELGERAWRHARGRARWPEASIADEEMVAGLIRHLGQQAAGELAKAGKQAKYVRLTVWHQNGQSESARCRLAKLTQNAAEISAGAQQLFCSLGSPAGTVQSVDLDVTTVASTVSDLAPVPSWLTAHPQAVGA